ncbi:UNVERIFIED_CONTAM: GDP-mannose transporter into the lumen of the Golgi [Siphonaria sp. JEL0065]|nr:GDP-mannose transporter into the lumen of the Golgi [Siphonaria sp. JEL0065]
MSKENPALAILAYCTASILMTVTNKIVLSSYQFRMPFLVLTMQSSCTVLMLAIFSRLGLISHRKYNSYDAKRWFPISFALVMMIYTGAKALQYMSIPLFTIFKNLTIILIAYGELLFFKGAPVTPIILAAFSMLILSSLIAGWSDIAAGNVMKKGTEDVSILVAYFWMSLNCLTTAFFTLFLRSKIKEFTFKEFDTVYYNNLLSIPVLVICSLLFEGGAFVDSYARFVNPGEESGDLFWLVTAILVSSVSAFAISYGGSWCVRVTSSTTYSMVGALNKLPISISGMVFFADPITFGSVSGVIIAFIGGIVYAYGKNKQNQANQGRLPVPVTDPSLNRHGLAGGDSVGNGLPIYDADDKNKK